MSNKLCEFLELLTSEAPANSITKLALAKIHFPLIFNKAISTPMPVTWKLPNILTIPHRRILNIRMTKPRLLLSKIIPIQYLNAILLRFKLKQRLNLPLNPNITTPKLILWIINILNNFHTIMTCNKTWIIITFLIFYIFIKF